MACDSKGDFNAGDATSDLFGSVVTEVLPSVFALFCAKSIDTLDELIANRDLYEFVRWSAARTYLRLIRDGRISRDEAVQRLRVTLKSVSQNNDSEGATAIVHTLYELGPTEAMDEIREAYDQYVVDEGIILLEDIEDRSENGHGGFQKEIDRCHPTGVLDTVELLRHWYWPGDEKPAQRVAVDESKRSRNSQVRTDATFHSNRSKTHDYSAIIISTPIKNDTSRVGRNDPCPSRSGKKFKKCCGN